MSKLKTEERLFMKPNCNS